MNFVSQEIQQVKIGERRLRVAELIREGHRSSRQITARLQETYGIEVHHSTVARDIQALERDYREVARDAIECERGITLTRLERYVQLLNEKLEEAITVDEEGRTYDQTLPTIRLLKELEESRRKLLGLDRPSKVAHTDPTGEKEYTGIPESFKRRFLADSSKSSNVEHEETVEADVVQEIEG